MACRLAREAGALILDRFRGGLDVTFKEGREPVTEADRVADELIRLGLVEAFPEDAVVTEESPDDLERLERRRVWFVDPLDGTKQFVRELPEFAVMIGLAVDGTPRLGLIHLPCESVTCLAVASEGAWELDAQGRRRRLAVRPAPGSLGEATFAMSRTLEGTRTARALERLAPGHVIRSGSVGRKAVLVARGEADAYFSLSGHSRQWDALAGDVLVHEAGGFFGTALGERIVYNTPGLRNRHGLLACHPDLRGAIVAALRDEIRPGNDEERDGDTTD
ncbi:MAG: hypothetical protein Kow0062_13280 [Acidobacteriota bacterium]